MAGSFLPIFIIIVTLIVGLFAGLFIFFFSTSHRLRIRDIINKDQYITDYWVMEKVDKETKELIWHSCPMFKKLKTNRPPAEAINVGRKGRLFAEGYRLSEDEFIWVTDKGVKLKEVVDKDGNKSHEIVDYKQDGTFKSVDKFEPFTAVQRSVLVGQFIKAEEISKHGLWTPDKIITVSAVGMLGLVIIMGLIFASDILNAYTFVQDKEAGIMKNLEKAILAAKGETADLVPLAEQGKAAIQTTGNTPPTE